MDRGHGQGATTTAYQRYAGEEATQHVAAIHLVHVNEYLAQDTTLSGAGY